jgi:hypothetical protein
MSTESDDDEGRPEHAGALTTGARVGTVARRDFSGSSLATVNPIAEAIAAQERANVEARYIMAMRRPRDLDDVRAMILNECRRPGFAEVATYSRPVGREQLDEDGPRGKKGEWVEVFAEGLSIRFAEVALRRMGNMSAKATTIYDDPHVRVIRVTAIDYESGGSWDMDITVPKTEEKKKLRKGQRPLSERVNSYGDRVFIVEATEQRVHTICSAEISKASRTAILRLVPGEIQDEAFDLCKKVAADREAKDPNAAKKRMLDGFGEVGVRPSEIVQWLGHPVEQGTREEFMALSKILSALREREAVWSDVLAERLTEVAERAKAKGTSAPTAPAAQGTPAPAAPASDPSAAREPETSKPAAAAPTTNGGKTTSTGKGAAALRGALRQNVPAKPAEDPREAEPNWMSGKRKPVELPPDTPPPADGMEYRACAGKHCTAVLEVQVNAAEGALCYGCAAAARDAE